MHPRVSFNLLKKIPYGGCEFVPYAYTGYNFIKFVSRDRRGVHYCISHISSAPTVKLVHFLPTSSVYIFAVAMPRSLQSPSLRRSPRHDKKKRHSESDVRRDERRSSPTRAAKKKRGNTKATEDNTKGAKKELKTTRTIRFLHLPMMMMPRCQYHLGVASKRTIWNALTKVLPAAVQEC